MHLKKRNQREMGRLTKTYRIQIWAIVMAFLAPLTIASICSAASPGETAAHFMKIGIGARGSSMGNAQSAVANDVNANYWNPAALTQIRFKELSFMHYDLVEGVRYNQASFGLPTEQKGTFALGFSHLDYGSIQGFGASGLPSGSLDASNLLITGSWAKKIMKDSGLSAGANLKYLNSDLAGFSASAPMLDVGLLMPFQIGKLRGLSVAATIKNMGPKIKYDSEGADLPQQFVLGSGLNALGGDLTLAIDLVKPKDNTAHFNAGVEYQLFNMINLRAGYTGLSEFVGDGITYGIGLEFNQWNIDYAMVPFGELGDTNRISVGFRFGHAQKISSAEDQVESSYRSAQRQYARGNGVGAYSTLNEILLVAPWHKPSTELKAKIEKQFGEMALSKDKARMDAQVADKFTEAKDAFDRDELVKAKKGFESILLLQPEHVASQVYLERVKNRYASLAHESFKLGMDYYAVGDYEKAQKAFEKTLTIDEAHSDAKAQLDKSMQMAKDATLRAQEMERLAGAAGSYKEGLAAYQKNDFETALNRFTEVQRVAPEYEEVGRYLNITKVSYANILFEQGRVHYENGQLDSAVKKLSRAYELKSDDERIKESLNLAERGLLEKNKQRSQELLKDGIEAYLGGDTKRAQKSWTTALELDPSNTDAKTNLERLQETKTNE